MTFPKTKLGIFPKNFKLITITGAVPWHRELGGPIRKVSLLGEHYDADASEYEMDWIDPMDS